MSNPIQLGETLAGIEYADLLARHGFKLRERMENPDYSCTVVDNGSTLLAFTYQRHSGENFHLARHGVDVSVASIFSEGEGWVLLADLCPDEVRALSKNGFLEFERTQKVAAFSRMLDGVMERVGKGEIQL